MAGPNRFHSEGLLLDVGRQLGREVVWRAARFAVVALIASRQTSGDTAP